MKRALRVAIACVAVTGSGALLSTGARAQTASAPKASADSLFRAGRALIGGKDYRGAEELLQRVADEFPKAEQAPVALYWRAWAFEVAGHDARDTAQLRAALVTIAMLDARYPSAPIAKDARWLRADVIDDQAHLGDPAAKQAMTAAMAHVLKSGISCEAQDVDLQLAAVERDVSPYFWKMPGLADVLLATQGPCARDAKTATLDALGGGAPVPVAAHVLLYLARDSSDSDRRAAALTELETVRNIKEVAMFLDSVTKANWAELRKRPLSLPTLAAGQPCPKERPRMVNKQYGLAIGRGPAFVTGFGAEGVLSWATTPGNSWGTQKVAWFFDPPYHGSILIRGGSLDGKGQLRFESGADAELAIAPDHMSHVVPPSRPSLTRVSAPGCYAFQIDGAGFSETIVFEAKQ